MNFPDDSPLLSPSISEYRLASPSTNRKRIKKATSGVWEVFTKENNKAVCRLCNKEYSAKTSTSNLASHINAHGLFLQDQMDQQSVKRRKSDSITDTMLSEPVADLSKAWLLFFILCYMPFSTIESRAVQF